MLRELKNKSQDKLRTPVLVGLCNNAMIAKPLLLKAISPGGMVGPTADVEWCFLTVQDRSLFSWWPEIVEMTH